MRFGVAAVLGWLIVAPAVASADDGTRIDIRARLAKDGRVTIAETHFYVFDRTDEKLYREFGLGADQAIVLTRVTRIGPGDVEHPLTAVEEVQGPDQYRYYDRGHVYYSVPPLGEHVALAYRFEYELVGAVTPAWAIAAGPGSRAPGELGVTAPWHRVADVYRDLKKNWPELGTRYRYDHDVLRPDLDNPHGVLPSTDYRLAFDDAWEDTTPELDLGAVSPDRDAYRAATVFRYVGPGRPAYAATTQAATRWIAIAAIPLIGVVAWALVVVSDRLRGGSPIDRTFVDTRFLTRAPEEIAARLEGVRPSVAGMLERLAGEGAIAIQVDPSAPAPDDDEDDAVPQVRMRRVAPDGALAPFERVVLDDLFGPTRELTTESHRARHRGEEYDPHDAIDDAMRDADKARAKPRWSLATIGLAAVMAWAIVRMFAAFGAAVDLAPIGAIVVFIVLALVTGWPAGWWHPGRPARGLLVPLVLLFAIAFAWLFMPNRPLSPDAWLAVAVMTLAGFFITLVRSRVPRRQEGAVADLVRMRRFAAGELRRPRPQLEDAWIPRLRALGLGREIDAWKTRHGGGWSATPQMGDGRPIVTTATFTGRAPAPWTGPAGWVQALYVYDEDDEEEAADASEQEDAS